MYTLVSTFILNLINYVGPIVLTKLVEFERYNSFSLHLSVSRSIILRFANMFVYFYVVFEISNGAACWESFVGQYIYNLWLMMFFFELFNAMFRQPIQFYGSKSRFRWVRKIFPAAEFDTVESTIELIYSDALVSYFIAKLDIFPNCSAHKLFPFNSPLVFS